MATNQNTKRKDKARVVLRKGESQRKDGKYDFRWTSPDGKRHSIYAATLEELREKENDIQRDSLEGIKTEARYVNCTPFVRQYGILFRKWGVFVCQRDNESTTERRR